MILNWNSTPTAMTCFINECMHCYLSVPFVHRGALVMHSRSTDMGLVLNTLLFTLI